MTIWRRFCSGVLDSCAGLASLERKQQTEQANACMEKPAISSADDAGVSHRNVSHRNAH